MDDKDLKLLHNKILEIAEYFDEFCNENGIVYYLMGGTALGAVRHRGFIPWDDDYDIFMDYKNYKKLLSLVDGKIDKSKYYFQKEDTKEWPMYFSKIRMNGTAFIEKGLVGKKMHHGIYIDIMCLNNTYNIKGIRYIHYLFARILNTKALSDNGYMTNSLIKKSALFLSRITIIGYFRRLLLWIVRVLNNYNTLLVGHFFGRAPFNKTSFPFSFLGKQRYMKFENLMLPVPNNVEGYLKVRYGSNYMDIPSDEEKMKYPSHAYIVDTFKSYKEYM